MVRTSLPKPRGIAGTVVTVSDTSPLSFDFPVGTVLTVRKFGPSKAGQPTVRGGFKEGALLLFAKETKLGRIPTEKLGRLSRSVPLTCTVIEVDKSQRRLKVRFD